MDVLKIKDSQGNWKAVPALVGPQGEQGIQGEKGDRGDTVIIAKDYADLTFPVYAGKTYCYHDNKPYVAKTDIATTEAWTAAHWNEVSFEDEISDLRSALSFYTGCEEMSFTPGYYIRTDKSIGDTIDLSPEGGSWSTLSYAVIDVAEGDKVTVNGTGWTQGRLWAFIDSENKLLSVSAASAVGENLALRAPANSSKCIINAATNTLGMCYKGDTVPSVASEARSNIADINQTIAADVYTKQSPSITLQGGFIGDTGAEVDVQTTSYSRSPMIWVHGKKYAIVKASGVSYTHPGNNGTVFFYDSSNAFQSKQETIYFNQKITIPSTAYSFRFFSSNAAMGIFSGIDLLGTLETESAEIKADLIAQTNPSITMAGGWIGADGKDINTFQTMYSRIPMVDVSGVRYVVVNASGESYTHGTGTGCVFFYDEAGELFGKLDTIKFNVRIPLPSGTVGFRFFADNSSLGEYNGIILIANIQSVSEQLKHVASNITTKADDAIEVRYGWSNGYLSAGQTVDSNEYKVSDFIPVYEHHIRLHIDGNDISDYSNQSGALHCYDENLKYIFYVQKVDFANEMYFTEGGFALTKYVRFFVPVEEATGQIVVRQSIHEVIQNKINSIILLESDFTGYFDNIASKIDFTIGRQSIIYLDALIADKNYRNKWLAVYCTNTEIGVTEESIVANPVTPVTDTQMMLRLSSEKNENLVTKTPIIRCNARQGDGSTKSIMLCGDSLIAGGQAASYVYSLLDEDADYNIVQVGSIESVDSLDSTKMVKHEGRGTWSWATYTDPQYENVPEPYAGKTNAFMHNGQLDFEYYCNTYNNGNPIDIAIFSLGTNDMGQVGLTTMTQKQANAARSVNLAKQVIDALLTACPNCKIALGMPAFGAVIRNKAVEDGIITGMAIYAKYMIDAFDDGKYSPNVTCVNHGAYIDRFNAYPHTDITDPLTGRVCRLGTNTVHPLTQGYYQWGMGYYNKIRAFLAGLL